MSQIRQLFINCNLATMANREEPYGVVADGAIGLTDGKIAWVGKRKDLPLNAEENADAVNDLKGNWVTPGLIDCHTHIVYGGDRSGEFEQRLEGVSYEEIARAGGGIRSTVTQTRAIDEKTLLEHSQNRVEQLCSEGVTVMEIKSGYGLNVEDELKQLRVARKIGERLPLTVRTTFLGAHALPPEFDGDPDGYIDHVCETILPAVAEAGLADAVDVFCETIGFTAKHTEKVFAAAKAVGLPVKGHIGQLADIGGAEVAARFGALSCDHLEYISDAGIEAMAGSNTVAVLLPGAFYFLRETQKPPIDGFRKHAVPIALATDCNPGSSPSTSILLMMNMACTLFRLTPEEALAGVTRNAALALGMSDTHGTLEIGKAADLAIWDIERPAELSYWIGGNPNVGIVQAGEIFKAR